jgi:peptidoglycan-N-acetylglucosamine deacetylase
MTRLLKIFLGLLFPHQFIVFRQKSSSAVALTFDDGPHPVNTRQLQEILKKEGVRATFFVSGNAAERYPELLKAIADNGHEIGNHSFSHRKIKEVGFDRYKEEIEKTGQLIKGYSGKETRLFRPPYGEITMGLIKFILNKGLKCIGWTVDSQDSYLKNREALVANFKQKTIRGGDIILLHEDYASTIEATQEIIIDLKMRGFSLKTVSELMDKK